MKLVILAGGLGSRISEETEVRPKPLIEIGGKPIIWHILQIYAHHGVTESIICAGYKGEMLKEYFVNLPLHNFDVTVDIATGAVTYHREQQLPWHVTVVDTGQETMTGGRLRRIRSYLDPDEPFCMTYGDGVGDIDITALMKFHEGHGLKATMTVVTPPGRFGAVEMDGDRIREFTEKPHAGGGAINGGYFVLNPDVIDLIEGDDTVWEKGPLERLAAGNQLAGYEHDGFWHPVDTLRDKRTLEALWKGSAPWKAWA